MGAKKGELGESSESDNGKQYDPFEHRVVKNPSSELRSTANLVKSSLGSGLLAMPLAFKNAGYGVGLFGTIIIGILCTHCVHIFVKTSHAVCRAKKEPQLGYAETCGGAFSHGPRRLRFLAGTARIVGDWATTCTYLGICCVYVVFISGSVKQIVERFYPETVLQIEVYCVIMLLPLAIACQIKSLKFLAVFSMVANVLLVIVFFICLYYVFKDPISFDERQSYSSLGKLPLFLSTVIFAMEGIGVVMPTENTMSKPQNFLGCPGVLIVSMTIVTVLYTVLGFFGYIKYGDTVLGSVTLNLPTDDIPAIIAKICIVLAISMTYPLQFYIPFEIMWKGISHKFSESHHTRVQILCRVFIVGCTVAVGVALPMLEQIINFVGALFYSLLGFIIPGIVETVFFWDTGLGKFKWVMWKNIFIIVLGFVALISGCTQTINEMINTD